jgi:hypothetical protein
MPLWANPQVVQTIPLLQEYDLGNWKAAPYAYEGDVDVNDHVLTIGLGDYLSGVVWKEELPARFNYEVELEARKTFGSDFFLGLTLPFADSHFTWVCGGWGGTVVGISDIDGLSADRNETTREMQFEKKRWYRFKIRVLEDRIQCWIDGQPVIDANLEGKRISMRPGKIEQSIPFGISTYDTMGEYRCLVWRNLAPAQP